MPESMDPKLVEQLNIVCDGYARRQRLNGDDRQEVLDHLQDSLDGYLTGQTRVTPEDALLIARARLGDLKGIVAQLRPEQTDNASWHARVSIAITTGFLTVIVLPLAILLYNPPAGTTEELTRFLLLLPLCFVVVETGVFFNRPSQHEEPLASAGIAGARRPRNPGLLPAADERAERDTADHGQRCCRRAAASRAGDSMPGRARITGANPIDTLEKRSDDGSAVIVVQ